MKEFLISICFLIASSILKSQSLSEILIKHTAAIGGRNNIDSTKSIFATGQVEMEGRSYSFTLLKYQGKLCRQEITIMGKTYYDITIPNNGWRTYSTPSHPVVKTAEEIKSGQDDLNIADGLYNFEVKGNKIALEGTEVSNNSTYYKLHSTDSSGVERYYYVDITSFQIMKVSEFKIDGINQHLDIYSFSDYRKTGNITLPYIIETPLGKVIFSKIVINQPIDPKQYDHD